MDERIDASMAEQPAKRLGRPRKTLPDADGSETTPNVSTDDNRQREADNSSESRYIQHPWSDIANFATSIAESGLIVTQLHTLGEGKRWAHWDVGAVTHSYSDGDYIKTSCGQTFFV